MKTKLNKKKTEIKISVTKGMFKTKNRKLDKAANEVMKEIEAHFKAEGKKAWPLSARHYITDIFYKAYGEQLENYLFKALFKTGKYMLKSGKNGGLVIDRAKK
jgi:hypothetical protein